MSTKKLLTLCGDKLIADVCKYAKKNNAVVYAASSVKGTALEEMADFFYHVDNTDNEAIEHIIRTEKIDGVFLGGNETVISANLGLLEKLGMPCYVKEKAWNVTSNKKKFKAACRAVGVPVAEEYDISQIDRIKFPVVIKPADSCGSQGVYLCKKREELEGIVSQAADVSKTNTVLIEEFLQGEEISVSYTIVDGEARISTMLDKYENVHCGEFNPVSDAYCYPSKRLSEYIEKIDTKMKSLFRHIGVTQGIAFVQGMYNDGEFKFFEMGYRLPGTSAYRYTDLLNGVSFLEVLLDFALYGKCDKTKLEKENPRFSKYCCTLTTLLKPGTIRRIDGVEKVKSFSGVVSIDIIHSVGDVIEQTNSLNQMMFWVSMCADTVDQLKTLVDAVQNTLKVFDESGNQMLYADFDVNRMVFEV